MSFLVHGVRTGVPMLGRTRSVGARQHSQWLSLSMVCRCWVAPSTAQRAARRAGSPQLTPSATCAAEQEEEHHEWHTLLCARRECGSGSSKSTWQVGSPAVTEHQAMMQGEQGMVQAEATSSRGSDLAIASRGQPSSQSFLSTTVLSTR